MIVGSKINRKSGEWEEILTNRKKYQLYWGLYRMSEGSFRLKNDK